jgi:hypothetical protein
MVATALVLAVGAGIGGYAIGHSHGADVSAAGEEGQQTGVKAGAANGARAGYANGYRKARGRAYTKSFPEAFRAAYANAFRDAGLAVPKHIPVPKASPAGG